MDNLHDLLMAIFGGAFLFFVCKKATDKRKAITKQCPRCGNICHASRWSTGMRYASGGYIHKFKCPNCGYEFYD